MALGVFYPSSSFYSYTADRPFGSTNAAPVGALGPNAVFMYQPSAGDGIAQSLPSLAGGKIHRVTVALGSRLAGGSFAGAQIAIFDSNNGQVLASKSVNSLQQPGVFQDVSFDADLGAAGCSGCVLVIRSLGLVTSNGYVDVDNVRVEALAGATEVDASSLTVDLPMAQQVVQRKALVGSSDYAVSVPVLGHVWGAARVAGSSVTATLINADGSIVTGVAANQPMAFDPTTGLYSGRLTGTVPNGGNYAVVIALAANGAAQRVRPVTNVGIGDVFLIAGQSNSATFGSWGATPYVTTQTQGRVADVANGVWAPMTTDPLPSISAFFTWPSPPAPGSSGSAWPRFGELASQRSGVPIGVVAVGYGGSAASQWLPGTDFHENYFGRALRFLAPGGFRAVMWHQGETDSSNGTSYAIYLEQMTSVIQGFRVRAGAEVPWYVAEVSALGGTAMGPRGVIASAQRQLTRNLAAVYPGASTDYIVDSHLTHDGVHFNAAGLEAHARLWADILSPGTSTSPVFDNPDFAGLAVSGGQIAYASGGSPGPTPGNFNMVNGWYATNAGDRGFADSGYIGLYAPAADAYVTDHLDASGRPVPKGASDAQIGFFFQVPTGTGFYQSASLTGRPGVSYALTLRLGRRLNQDAGFPGLRITLTMGGQTVATRTVALADMSNGAGAFTPFTLNYTVPMAAAPGQKFAVRVETLSAPANSYLDLDSASLIVQAP